MPNFEFRRHFKLMRTSESIQNWSKDVHFEHLFGHFYNVKLIIISLFYFGDFYTIKLAIPPKYIKSHT